MIEENYKMTLVTVEPQKEEPETAHGQTCMKTTVGTCGGCLKEVENMRLI